MSGFFSKSNEKKNNFNWNYLTDVASLEELVEKSNEKPIAIFKHSTRCGISRAVLKAFEKQFNDVNAEFYYLDLLQYRNVSNEIATRFNVQHQSPQLIVLKNGKVIKHDSHYNLLDVEIV